MRDMKLTLQMNSGMQRMTIAVALLVSASSAAAQQRFLLIDRDLRADTVDLVAIDNGNVESLRSGLIDRRPMGDLLVIMRLEDGDASSRFDAGDRLVELADGQRWVGAPAQSPRPDHLAWKIDRLGVLAVPLDEVLRVRLEAGAPLPAFNEKAAADRLALANGDALSGLLVSIGDDIEFEATGSSAAMRLPLTQVASMALANWPRRPSGMMLWLADGSVLRVDECRWSPGALSFTTTEGSIKCRVESAMLRGISFAAERVMPLANLRPQVRQQSKWLSVVDTPTVVDAPRAIGLSDVQMRGPIEARYALPQGATRFAATAIVPRFVADWADFNLTVLVDDQVVLEAGMDGTGRSRREIDVPLHDASTLTIRLEEGARGPIQDVILLQRPMLLFD